MNLRLKILSFNPPNSYVQNFPIGRGRIATHHIKECYYYYYFCLENLLSKIFNPQKKFWVWAKGGREGNVNFFDFFCGQTLPFLFLSREKGLKLYTSPLGSDEDSREWIVRDSHWLQCYFFIACIQNNFINFSNIAIYKPLTWHPILGRLFEKNNLLLSKCVSGTLNVWCEVERKE